MFPRLYSLLLAGCFTASLSIPTLLHARYFVTVDTQTWLVLAIIQFALVIMAQLCLMHRMYSQYKLSQKDTIIFNAIFIPVTSSLTSFAFITLLSFSFLYNEYGNNYINLKSQLITLDQNSLISALHYQLLTSIFGGVLFSIELYAELFRSIEKDSPSLPLLSQIEKKRIHDSNNTKKGYRKSVTRSSHTFKPKNLDTIHRYSTTTTTTTTPTETEDDEQEEQEQESETTTSDTEEIEQQEQDE